MEPQRQPGTRGWPKRARPHRALPRERVRALHARRRARSQRHAGVRLWPFTHARARRSTQAPLPSVPTLILSGADDLRTPTAERARSRRRRSPARTCWWCPTPGHSVLGAEPTACAQRRAAGAVRRQADQALRSHAAAAGPAPAAAAAARASRGVAARARLPRAAGAHAARGRAHARRLRPPAGAAGARTARLGQPRGALARCASAACAPAGRSSTAAGSTLHGYSYVPGVTISGTITAGSAEPAGRRARPPRTARCASAPHKCARRRRSKAASSVATCRRVPCAARGYCRGRMRRRAPHVSVAGERCCSRCDAARRLRSRLLGGLRRALSFVPCAGSRRASPARRCPSRSTAAARCPARSR